MEKNKISLLEFNGNPNIGNFMFANDRLCLIGKQIDKTKTSAIESILNVPVYEISVLNTDLIGIFIAGNNDMIIVPEMFENELNELEKICKKHDIKLIQILNNKNTYGNNMVVSDEEILITNQYEKKFDQELSKKTKLKIIRINNQLFDAIGATIRYLKGKYCISQEYKQEEVKSIINKIALVGTINKGSNYISAGLIGNSNGILIGSTSSSVEIQNVVETLDYL